MKPIGQVVEKVTESIKTPGKQELSDWEKRTEMERLLKCRDLVRVSKVTIRHRKFDKSKTSGKWLEKYKAIESALDTEPSMFALLGSRGTGKTQIATCIIKHECWKEKTALYAKTMDFFIDLKSSYNDDNSDENTVIRTYVKPSILVLDEIQVRSESAWENNILTHLIDKRYDLMKSTILIGNLLPGKLIDCVGESIYSRLIETGGVVKCDWETFRK